MTVENRAAIDKVKTLIHRGMYRRAITVSVQAASSGSDAYTEMLDEYRKAAHRKLIQRNEALADLCA